MENPEEPPDSLKLTASLHLKIRGWNTILYFWGVEWDVAYFQGRKRC